MRKIRVGIDIGSSKTMIVVGELYNLGKNIKILDKIIIPSNGIKKGKIIDGDLFSKTLKTGKERLEEKLGIRINRATVGVSGNDVKSSTTEIEYILSEEDIEVTEEHCDQILEISKEKVVREDEQILSKEIYNYRLDDSGIMKNPIGKKGQKLEARVHLIKIPKARVKKIVETLNKAGIEVDSLIYSGEAGSKAVLKTQDKMNGVALVDIGHGLTEITIFKNNRLISANVIPIGGMHYINDLKYVLELDKKVVTDLLLELKNKKSDEKVTVTYLDNGKSITKTYDVSYLKEILDARTDEILEYIVKSIEASGYKEYLKSGIILSGGVVGDYEIVEKLRKLIDHEVRIGSIININGMNTSLKSPSSVTGMGILLTALEEEYKNLQKDDNKNEVEAIEKEEIKTEKKEKKKIETKKEMNNGKEGKKNSTTSKLKRWMSNFI